MREFGPVVQTLVLAMIDTWHDLLFRCSIALEFVGDQPPWGVTQALEELAKKTFCRLPVTPALHKDIEHVAILIDWTPQVMVPAPDG